MGIEYLKAALDEPPVYGVSRSIYQEEVAFPRVDNDRHALTALQSVISRDA